MTDQEFQDIKLIAEFMGWEDFDRNDLNAIVQVEDKLMNLEHPILACHTIERQVRGYATVKMAWGKAYNPLSNPVITEIVVTDTPECLARFTACLKALDYLKQRETNG